MAQTDPQGCEYSNIVLSRQEIQLETIEGYRFIPAYETIMVDKEGPGMPANWQAKADAVWVAFRPYTGPTPDRIQVSAKLGMPAGTHEGTLTFSSHVSILPSPHVKVILHVAPIPEPEPPQPEPPQPEPPAPPPAPPPPEPPAPEPQPSWLRQLLERLMEWLGGWLRR